MAERDWESADCESDGDPAVGTALAPIDRSGWPIHPKERRDCCSRIKAFPPEVAAWRKSLARQVLQFTKQFAIEAPVSREQLLFCLDHRISLLREVARILAELHAPAQQGKREKLHDSPDFPVDAHVARFWFRLNPYRALDVNFRSHDLKQLRSILPDMVLPTHSTAMLDTRAQSQRKFAENESEKCGKSDSEFLYRSAKLSQTRRPVRAWTPRIPVLGSPAYQRPWRDQVLD